MKAQKPCSNKSNMISGIPQDSIQEPILLAIYINDLTYCVTCQCKIFADYIKIYAKSLNHGIVQMDINNMIKWLSN